MDNATPTQQNNNEISGCDCLPKCKCNSAIRDRCIGGWFMTFIVVTWIAGAVIAKGFWSTLAAWIFPPWAWYLIIEKSIHVLLGPSWL